MCQFHCWVSESEATVGHSAQIIHHYQQSRSVFMNGSLQFINLNLLTWTFDLTFKSKVRIYPKTFTKSQKFWNQIYLDRWEQTCISMMKEKTELMEETRARRVSNEVKASGVRTGTFLTAGGNKIAALYWWRDCWQEKINSDLNRSLPSAGIPAAKLTRPFMRMRPNTQAMLRMITTIKVTQRFLKLKTFRWSV